MNNTAKELDGTETGSAMGADVLKPSPPPAPLARRRSTRAVGLAHHPTERLWQALTDRGVEEPADSRYR